MVKTRLNGRLKHKWNRPSDQNFLKKIMIAAWIAGNKIKGYAPLGFFANLKGQDWL